MNRQMTNKLVIAVVPTLSHYNQISKIYHMWTRVERSFWVSRLTYAVRDYRYETVTDFLREGKSHYLFVHLGLYNDPKNDAKWP